MKINKNIKDHWKRYLFYAVVALVAAEFGVKMFTSGDLHLVKYSIVMFVASFISAACFMLDIGVDTDKNKLD